MASLSVCMIVQNSEKTLPIALTSLEGVYDELIIVDGGSCDLTLEIATQYGANIIHSPWSGNHSQQRNVYLERIKTDWFFVLDSDEFVDLSLVQVLREILDDNSDLTKYDWFKFQRRWIAPSKLENYLTSSPHERDYQTRLFKNREGIYYTGTIHEFIHGFLRKNGRSIRNAYIYHLDLYINSEAQREQKVRRYSHAEMNSGGVEYYLPELYSTQSAKWDIKSVSNSIFQLIKVYISMSKQSQIDNLIPPEIKEDELYNFIEKIARYEDIQSVLEIGSSSGGGSTEAFVKGLRDNSNQPTLFCIEVSNTRFQELQNAYQKESFVKCYNVSSVAVDEFPQESEIINFYNRHKTGLNQYPLEEVLRWLRQDIDYVQNNCKIENGIDLIIEDNQIEHFDVVLIDGSEFTGFSEFQKIYGAKFILLDDINTFKNHQSYDRLINSTEYELLVENKNLRNGYAIFKRQEVSSQVFQDRQLDVFLPIHFFTIVLNGEPFIRYHINAFKKLPFPWHWHIVEGVADLKHDTAWSKELGGRIVDEFHKQGRSNDGTSEYLDELAENYPENITIYRKPLGEFWEGKREMVNAPLTNIQEECLLWQIDVDELWTAEQLSNGRNLFINNPNKTAAFYWCWYFVGEQLVVTTRNCYSQNPKQDWLRTWYFKPSYFWAAHEPPVLVKALDDGTLCNLATINPLTHTETEAEGLVFQHFAYVLPEQLKFKEQYYGYKNALRQWENLQKETRFPILLREYFSWVGDDTLVDRINFQGLQPILQKDIDLNWKFVEQSCQSYVFPKIVKEPIIAVDGIFFQYYNTGIARVWKSLLEEWSKSGFSRHIFVLDRENSTPKIPGFAYLTIPQHDYGDTNSDRALLQQICDEKGVDLFVSTYYTTPTNTPSVFMAYDMIPEVLGVNVENNLMWREKHHGIQHASAYISISENTARDLLQCFSEIDSALVTVAHCGIKEIFTPASPGEIAQFKLKYGITKPYFILVAPSSGYKNAQLFFEAFSQLPTRLGFDILSTGNRGWYDEAWRQYTIGNTVYTLQLNDEELRLAYAGAVALVYPSKYEGFGLPVLEALACGCPVITTPNASIPEVAGKAAIYVKDDDVEGMTNALCEVQKPTVRQSLIERGIEQAKQFSWKKMADKVSSTLIEATLLPLKLREANFIIFPDWTQPEEDLAGELQQVLKGIAMHPERDRITLLIDTTGISQEDAELFLSGIAMNLLMEEEIDLSEGAEISLLEELALIQWKELCKHLRGKIALEYENKSLISEAGIELMEINIFSR